MFLTGSRSGAMNRPSASKKSRSALAPGAIRPRSSRPIARAPPLDRRAAMAGDQLLELVDRLADVDLHRHLEAICLAPHVAQERLTAGVDLRRREEALDQPAVRAVEALDELDRAAQRHPPGV